MVTMVIYQSSEVELSEADLEREAAIKPFSRSCDGVGVVCSRCHRKLQQRQHQLIGLQVKLCTQGCGVTGPR